MDVTGIFTFWGEDVLLARHAIVLGRKDCVTSQKNVCVGGYRKIPVIRPGLIQLS